MAYLILYLVIFIIVCIILLLIIEQYFPKLADVIENFFETFDNNIKNK